MATKTTLKTIAAVDLGSNSFHMIVAQLLNGQLRIIDRLREMVQLGAGLNAQNKLSASVQRRALACLERFGQRLHGMPAANVRCVGTHTLRRAQKAAEFLEAAQQALGYPIEIIAGREEARLIYLGVAHSVAHEQGRRLVLDIGGGSTELIIGKGFEPLEMESLHIGCVSLSKKYFADGVMTRGAFEAAEIAARQEFQPVQGQLRRLGWSTAIGSSGTLLAASTALRAFGGGRYGITLSGLQTLRRHLLNAGHVDKIALAGINDGRRAVFPGGLAIITAVFQALDISRMRVSDGALREGLLYDLLGRNSDEDVRERTIQTLSERYHIDTAHALRVARTAEKYLRQVAGAWELDTKTDRAQLMWTARLHEIGLAIAHNGYHRHGAYLIENSDLPGFSRPEQQRLALLIRAHRRSLPIEMLQDLPLPARTELTRLSVLLRLAVLMHRGRDAQKLPTIRLQAAGSSLRFVFPQQWLHRHPLTQADLTLEAAYLAKIGMKLRFK